MKTKLCIMVAMFMLSACALKKEPYNFRNIENNIIGLEDRSKIIDTAILNTYIIRLKKEGRAYTIEIPDVINKNIKKQSPSEIYRKNFSDQGSFYVLNEYSVEGAQIKETKISKYVSEIEVDERIDKYFRLLETYYLSGRIKSRLIRSSFNFYLGKQFYYNENGNLINVIDLDKEYTFTYKDAMKFYLKKWKSFGYMAEIDRPTGGIEKGVLAVTNKRVWVLTHQSKKTGLSDIYYLDGQSGSLIKREKRDLRTIR